MLVRALAALVVAAPAAHATLPLRHCVVQRVDARCGTMLVPENRARPAGRTIGLHVVVISAARAPAQADAFTYLVGGPGGAAASDMPAAAMDIWPDVHARHDILLVDQRGTGGSNKLECPAPTGPTDTDTQRRHYVTSCLAALPGDAAQYGTRAAMDDLDAVRAALGYRTLDVYGTSYGATAAQVYLERHPGSVRTLILDGATFLDVPFYSRYARNGQHALNLITLRCAAQLECSHAFPHWRDSLASLIAEWNKKPEQVGSTGKLTGDGLAGVIQRMTLTADSASYIPLVVSRAAKGDDEPLSRYVGSSDVSRSAMYWSIMCNEPWVGLDSRGPWPGYLSGLTTAALARSRSVCRYIPKRAERAADWRRPHSRVPVLVLAGAADPQDPAGNLPGLRLAFPNSLLVVAPGQGHGVGQYGCLGGLVARFVDRATVKGLDPSCVLHGPLPAFAIH